MRGPAWVSKACLSEQNASACNKESCKEEFSHQKHPGSFLEAQVVLPLKLSHVLYGLVLQCGCQGRPVS